MTELVVAPPRETRCETILARVLEGGEKRARPTVADKLQNLCFTDHFTIVGPLWAEEMIYTVYSRNTVITEKQCQRKDAKLDAKTPNDAFLTSYIKSGPSRRSTKARKGCIDHV